MIENNKLYRKITLGLGHLCIATEGFEIIMFEAHEGKHDSYSDGRKLS